MKNHPSFLSGVPEIFILMGHDAVSWNNWIQLLHDTPSYPKEQSSQIKTESETVRSWHQNTHSTG